MEPLSIIMDIGAAGLMKSLKDNFEHISWTRGVSTRKCTGQAGSVCTFLSLAMTTTALE